MKRILTISILALAAIFAPAVHSQSSGTTVPPPPYCTSANAGALYTNTGTSPATVYTCSYYNLAWQWVVNPSYGGLVLYPTVPSTCSGALPVFLAGWPTNTQMYVCVNGVPVPQAIGPPGPVGPSGPPLNWRGNWEAYTPYARNDGFIEAGIGYVVITSYTSGATFGSLDTANSVQIATGCAGGVCQILEGGTGANSAAGALANLGGNPRTVEPFLCDPVYAASIGSTIPSWCVGSTLDTWTKSACALLTTGTDPITGEIQGGGLVDMTGFGSTPQTIAGSVFAGCMSHQKAVEFLFPPAPRWTVTQTDGGCAFPLDEGSSISTPGITSANNGIDPVTNAHYDTGVVLDPTAIVDAIVCPAYPIYDARPQQAMSVAGVTVLGAAGAQVTHGLVDMSYIYSNSQASNITCLSANEACIYAEDSTQIEVVNPSFTLDNTGDSTVDGTPIVFYANTIPYPTGGVLVGNAKVDGGQIIGGNGGKRVYIKENPASGDVWNVNGTAITWMSSGASGNQVNVGVNPTASAAAFCAIAAWGTDPNLVNSTCTTLSAYPGMVRLLPVSSTFEQSFTATKHIETPSGAIPGTVYTLTVAPPPEYAIATASPTGTLFLTVNGVAQTPITAYTPSGKYSIAGTTITFAAPTPAGATIVATWDKVKVKTYYNSAQIGNDGYGGWETGIQFTGSYFEREGHAATTPAIGVHINDCWYCSFTSTMSRGGAIQGQDAFYVTGTVAEVKSNTFYNDSVWGGPLIAEGWANALTDTVTPNVYPVSSSSNETTLDQIIVNPDQWQQNIPSNTALIGLGTDVLTNNGLFSGTGTVYSAYWETRPNASLPNVTWALNTSDPPPSPAFNGATGGTSSQYVTIGANSTLTPAAVGIQDAAGVRYSMVAGTKYTIAVQAREVSGNIPTLSVFVGSSGINNCHEGQPNFSLTSTWGTYKAPCTALATITNAVTIDASGVQGAAGAVGQFAFGNIQLLPALGLVPNDLAVAQTNNTVGPFTGTADCVLYQNTPQQTSCLAGNTSATDQVFVSHGTGAAPAAPTLTNSPALSGANLTSATIPVAALVSDSTTVNGQTCPLSGSCTVAAAATSITPGTTTIGGGSGYGFLTQNGTSLVDTVMTAAGDGVFGNVSGAPGKLAGCTGANSTEYAITETTTSGGASQFPACDPAPHLSAANMTSFPSTLQAALSLVKGTYADTDLCTYTASGTLLNCNTAAAPAAVGLGNVTNDVQTKNSIVPNSFSGIRFGNSGSVDTAATPSQIVTVIGSTAVANATAATSATNATNIATTGGSSSASTFYPTFVASNSSGNQAATTTSALNFVPSTGMLSATGFTGALTGNASTATSATTAANLSGTPALPNGTTATTQSANSADSKLATDNTVINAFATPPTAGYGGTTPEPVAATTVTASGTMTANGLPTGCVQFPCALAAWTVAPTTSTSTSSIGPTTIITPTYATGWQMCIYLDVIVAGSAGNYYGGAYYTTDGHTASSAVTPTVSATTQWNSSFPPTTPVAGSGGCGVFYADANTAIQYKINVLSVTGTPTLRYWVTLERME